MKSADKSRRSCKRPYRVWRVERYVDAVIAGVAQGNARIVLIATPLDECIRRIRNDPTRAGQFDRMEQLARDWWSAFTPGGGQNV